MDDCTDVREWRPAIVEEMTWENRERLRKVGMVLDKMKMEACIFRKKKERPGRRDPRGHEEENYLFCDRNK